MALLAAALGACGATEPGPSDGVAGTGELAGASGASGASGAAASGGGASAGSGTGGGSFAGSAGSGATGGGGAASTDTSRWLLPALPGRRWTYEFSPLDTARPMLDTCEAPFSEVGEETTIAGRSGMPYKTYCGPEAYLLAGAGDQWSVWPIVAGQLDDEYEMIHSPVAEGEPWTAGGTVSTWHRGPASLEAPAGSFSDCWERAVGEVDPLSFFYCRGVGLVLVLDTYANYRLSLTSKNF